MATPIRETPVLYGKDAKRFLQEVAANARRDHSVAFARAKATFDRLTWKDSLTGHAKPNR